MSILIPGMEMPTSCAKCPCSDDMGKFCHPANEYIPMLGRPEWCPLIELPPHGRLGDLDALTHTIEGVDWYHQNEEKDMVHGANSFLHQAWYKEQDVYRAIEGAPTIIPAEEGMNG